MNELLESAVRYKRMAEDNSLDEETKEYYKKMLVDAKMYLDGLALLKNDFVLTEQPVTKEIKEPTPPIVKQKPKSVLPKKPPVVDKVKKSPVRKPPVKKQQKPQQKVRGNEGKPSKRSTKPQKPMEAPPKAPEKKEEFF